MATIHGVGWEGSTVVVVAVVYLLCMERYCVFIFRD